jgi:hypothetical protein
MLSLVLIGLVIGLATVAPILIAFEVGRGPFVRNQKKTPPA